MKNTICAFLITTAALISVGNANAIVFTNLCSFSPANVANQTSAGSYGGNNPQAALLLSGNTVYGTTVGGSTNNDGTIFKYSSGTGFVNIHTFTGPDGANPQSDLIMSGSTLFGTTANGGANGGGTVFAVNTNGTGFTTLFSFAYTNGGNPMAGLTLSGNTLYGTTAWGGAYGAGSVFAVNTDGTGFTNIYNFSYTNGASPEGDLLLLGNTLYGTTTFGGGANGLGTVFAVNTDGTGFTNLMVFTGANGANPQAGLSVVSNVLCGTTTGGGNYNAGTAFLIGTNGTGFSLLYNFGVTYTDAQNPYSRLAVSSNGASSYSLYGTTEYGGSSTGPCGTVFSINVSGPGFAFSGYSIVYSFTSSFQSPVAGLALSGNTLYGTVSGDGGPGGLFSVTTTGSFEELHTFQSLAQSGFTFARTNSDGSDSRANLALSGRTLYGTATGGGTQGCGTIFAINTDGTGFINLSSLGTSDIGPSAGLTLSENILYGITTGEYAFGDGYFGGPGSSTIFALNTDGTGFTNISSGYSSSLGNLTLSGNTLYGTTYFGGSASLGTIFEVNTDGTDPATIFNFDSVADSGFLPSSGVVSSGNVLYGTTEQGGSYYFGTVYAVNTDGTGYTNIVNFGGTNGSLPEASLVLSGNRLYGTTRHGGAANSFGTIFAVNTDGSDFTNLYNFSGYDGMWPQANLILCGDTLYGTTTAGGSGGSGTVFALSLGPIPLCIQPAGTNVVLTWGNPSFSLESATTVSGPYTPVLGATSPYTNAITASPQFFRLAAQ